MKQSRQKKVQMKKTENYHIPEELQIKFDENPKLKEEFHKLTPGRQHQYLYYISQVKRSETRQKRIEKYIDHIMDGKGMNDKYKHRFIDSKKKV